MRLSGRAGGVVVIVLCATLTYGTGGASAATFTPIATWHMDETSGTTMRDSTSAAGTSNGTTHSVQLGVTGKVGKAFSFNGTSSYVSVPSSGLNPYSSPVKVTINLKTTRLPSSSDWDLIRKGYYSTTGGEIKVELMPSGRASCGFKGSSGYAELEAGPSNLNNGAWHTVTCIKESSSIQLRVDGQSYTKTAKVGSIANSQSVIIGAYPGSEYFQGSLDEASISLG
jgi:hypothetical protein